MTLHRGLLAGLFGLAFVLAALAQDTGLDALLASVEPPAGVVFEVVDRDPQALHLALPWVAEAAARLRQRFPGLAMAAVTHGREMFALQRQGAAEHPGVHRLTERLVRQEGIPVHVCETYAERKGVAPEAFPAYVDVAPEGPAQIRNYEALGYVRVIVPKSARMKPIQSH